MDNHNDCAAHSDPTDQMTTFGEQSPRCPFLYYIFLWDRQANPLPPYRREALRRTLQALLLPPQK